MQILDDLGKLQFFLQSRISTPPRTRLTETFCFSRQPRAAAISLGRVTARLVLPTRVIFLMFLFFSFIGKY